MGIQIEELLPKGVSLSDIPEDHQKNISGYLEKIQAFREKCGLAMVCTNGYRTKEHHEEIYREKNAIRLERGLEPVKIPWGSAHLSGNAADFLDKDRKLAEFVDNNEEWCKSMGFHFESKDATSIPCPWLHVQCVSPASGNLWFEP